MQVLIQSFVMKHDEKNVYINYANFPEGNLNLNY